VPVSGPTRRSPTRPSVPPAQEWVAQGAPLGFGLGRGGDGGVTVIAQLVLVLADGRGDVVAVGAGGQRTAQLRGIPQGQVRPGAGW
jgi:hypothetical protein